MIVTMTVRRLPNQHAIATLSSWDIAVGTVELARVSWDPTGRMTAVDAFGEAAVQLLRVLGRLDLDVRE